MELHLKIIGSALALLSLVHMIFPRYFNWEKELASLSLMNRQMMQVHTFFIAFVVLLMGLLCLCCTDDLIQTKLGHSIALGLSIFWGVRLLFQFFVYSPELWRGKMFETIAHFLATGFWLYLTIIFFLIYNS
jgi:hypothetical protein